MNDVPMTYINVTVVVITFYEKNRRRYFVSSGWDPYRGVHMNDLIK
jgi:hypothetical protein